jgi:hypothetical protein
MKKSILLLSSFLMLFTFSNNISAQVEMIDFDEFNVMIDQYDQGRIIDMPGSNLADENLSRGAAARPSISTNIPNAGVLLTNPTKFRWNSKYVTCPVVVKIGIQGSDEIIYLAKTKQNSLNLPLNELDLDEAVTYYVEVEATCGTKNYFSEKTTFTTCTQVCYDRVIGAVTAEREYQLADNVRKILMKAMSLEKNNLHYEAQEIYQTYMPDDRSDSLMRNMKDAYAARRMKSAN